MHELLVEEHSFGANPGTKDLARHLYTRINCGKAVIVTNKPNPTLAALRKQWMKLCRKVQRERASTLDSVRNYELSEVISRMQAVQFTAQWGQDLYQPKGVYLATIDQLLLWQPECRTLYITCKVSTEQMHLITAWMPKGALVVRCLLSGSK